MSGDLEPMRSSSRVRHNCCKISITLIEGNQPSLSLSASLSPGRQTWKRPPSRERGLFVPIEVVASATFVGAKRDISSGFGWLSTCEYLSRIRLPPNSHLKASQALRVGAEP